MPHAVVLGASIVPAFGSAPLARLSGNLHKVVEAAHSETGWLLKSLVVNGAGNLRFLSRIDTRPDGLLVRLDDHMHVDRSPPVFEHLAVLTQRLLAANPDSSLGATNLAELVASLPPLPAPAA